MSEVIDDFRALKEHTRRQRQSSRAHGTEEIQNLVGYRVKQLTEYHFRINHVLDIYPTQRRWHNLKTRKRGGYGKETLQQLVARQLGSLTPLKMEKNNGNSSCKSKTTLSNPGS